MIPPTVGRNVHVWRHASRDSTQPEIGFITFVHSDSFVNVTGFAKTGEHFHIDECVLVQDETDVLTVQGDYATWMPYQKGQAAKTDALIEAAVRTEQQNVANNSTDMPV